MDKNIINILLSDLSNTTQPEYNVVNTLRDSDSDDDVELVYSILHKKKRKRVCIKNYIQDVVYKYDDKEFKTHFRISRSLFNSLAIKFQNITDFIALRVSELNISSEAHVAVFLWFASHEACCFRDLSDRFNLSLSSVNRVIRRMITFFSNMCPDIIAWPSTSKKLMQFFKSYRWHSYNY
ncbi:uncharacterized protein LOC119678724 [Teleopsis dalmanni]|uniref:uncharacterized protein LOC119663430 n=1 Tax=Teleopsis dalmanni TaxID=139649 RepID=UPI0018CEFDAC|nr:uncharacterized protein LOC119663430 [Teleopsis dalmanni]XP_037930029.1 uncharacterized protein LOC119664643 [Teleopsis dalmanni]XP_037946652.1 uncharacterized protein LOC119678724 [Teleopsis dalmanni]